MNRSLLLASFLALTACTEGLNLNAVVNPAAYNGHIRGSRSRVSGTGRS